MQQILEKLVSKGWTGESGLFVSVMPDKRSKKIIKAIADVLEAECNTEDLYCTIMYSRYDTPKELSLLPKTKKFLAYIKNIETLGKNDESLVITLESDDLQKEHARLKQLGAIHHWNFYLPYVTIQTNKPWDDYYLDNVRDSIVGRELIFKNYSWDDIRYDN